MGLNQFELTSGAYITVGYLSAYILDKEKWKRIGRGNDPLVFGDCSVAQKPRSYNPFFLFICLRNSHLVSLFPLTHIIFFISTIHTKFLHTIPHNFISSTPATKSFLGILFCFLFKFLKLFFI